MHLVLKNKTKSANTYKNIVYLAEYTGIYFAIQLHFYIFVAKYSVL